jgi:hypothetical protein
MAGRVRGYLILMLEAGTAEVWIWSFTAALKQGYENVRQDLATNKIIVTQTRSTTVSEQDEAARRQGGCHSDSPAIALLARLHEQGAQGLNLPCIGNTGHRLDIDWPDTPKPVFTAPAGGNPMSKARTGKLTSGAAASQDCSLAAHGEWKSIATSKRIQLRVTRYWPRHRPARASKDTSAKNSRVSSSVPPESRSLYSMLRSASAERRLKSDSVEPVTVVYDIFRCFIENGEKLFSMFGHEDPSKVFHRTCILLLKTGS